MKPKPFHPEDAVRDLTHLLSVCSDGVEGYRHAAAAIDDAVLQAALIQAAAEREQIATVLAYALADFGFKPVPQRSLKGAVHRRCLDALGIVHPNAEAVLHECERGEQASLAAFESVLAHTLPSSVRPVVQAQYGRLFQSVEVLRSLTGGQAAKAS